MGRERESSQSGGGREEEKREDLVSLLGATHFATCAPPATAVSGGWRWPAAAPAVYDSDLPSADGRPEPGGGEPRERARGEWDEEGCGAGGKEARASGDEGGGLEARSNERRDEQLRRAG